MKPVRGALTLEAAIVMPLVIISLGLIIQLLMVIHDGASLRALEHGILADYSRMEVSFGHIYDQPISLMEAIDPETLSIPLMLGEVEAITYNISDTDYVLFRQLEVHVSMPMSVFGIHMAYDHSTCKTVTSPTEVIRLVDFADNLTSDFVLLSQVKGKYSQSLKLIEKLLKDKATLEDAVDYMEIME